MNSSKKLAKNNGIGVTKEKKSKNVSVLSGKNRILIILGVLAVVVLCAGVCYMQLRPRPVLEVTRTAEDGSKTTNTLYMKEAVYQIYQVEAQYNSAMYQQMYQQLYHTSYWEAEDVDGKGRNGASAAKKQVMDMLKQREIVCMEAEAQGQKLTDEEIKAAHEEAKKIYDGLTDGQKKLDGLDQDTLNKVFERDALAEKYRQVIISESGVDAEALKASVNKEDYHQYTLQYYMVKNESEAAASASGGAAEATPVSEEQKKKNLKNMEELKKKAATAEDFTKLLEEGDTTGISQMQTQNLVKNEMKDSTFLTKKDRNKLIKMKNGEISDIIEGEDGYYLVRMENNDDSAAYDTQCETVVREAEDNAFSARLQELTPKYSLEVQSYWKGRVKLGGYTVA